MTFNEMKRRLMVALENPNTGNKLVASIALADYDDSRQERIDQLEAALHKIATAPWAQQRAVDIARSALGSEEPHDGDAWSGGFCASH